jgi:hypothetical protein
MPPASDTESDSQYGTKPGHLKSPVRLLAHNNSVNVFDDVLYDWKFGSANQNPPPWSATSPGKQSSSSHQLTGLTPNPRYQTPRSEYDAFAPATHGQSTRRYPSRSVSDSSRPLRLIAPSTHVPAITISSSDLVQVSSETAILHDKTTGDLSEPVVYCGQCSSPFTGTYRRRNLTRHVKVTHKHETCRCEMCNKIFRRSDALLVHQRGRCPGLIGQPVPGNQTGQSPSDSIQPLIATNIHPVEPENSIQNMGHMYDEHTQLALVHTYSTCETSDLSDSQDLDTASFNNSFTSPTELTSMSQDLGFPPQASSSSTAPEFSHLHYSYGLPSLVYHPSSNGIGGVPEDGDLSFLSLGSHYYSPVQSDLVTYEFSYHSSNQED